MKEAIQRLSTIAFLLIISITWIVFTYSQYLLIINPFSTSGIDSLALIKLNIYTLVPLSLFLLLYSFFTKILNNQLRLVGLLMILHLIALTRLIYLIFI